MDFLEFLGYIGAGVIGISLGLVGGGGSILTVPVLVYLFGVEPVLSTAYSLFIVGLTSLAGAIKFMQKKLVSYKTAIIFAVPAFIAVFLTRLYIVPAIPSTLFVLGGFTMTKSIGIMLFFALVMLMASFSMIKQGKESAPDEIEPNQLKFNYPLILLEGAVVGLLTGIVGAGGGFLIIPALVLLAKLPMKMAVGTSLLIIAAKSLLGFIGDLRPDQLIDWWFLNTITILAVIGVMIGSYLSNFIASRKLKTGFGWFVLVMAVFIIGSELFWN